MRLVWVEGQVAGHGSHHVLALCQRYRHGSSTHTEAI